MTFRFARDSRVIVLSGLAAELAPAKAALLKELTVMASQLMKKSMACDAAQSQLLQDLTPLVHKIANKYSTWIDLPAVALLTYRHMDRGARVVIETHVGDIVKQRVDCLVNAANENLLHSGGVAKTIANACGEALVAESAAIVQKQGSLKVSQCVFTTSGALAASCKAVMHAVGPRWNDDDQLGCKALLEATITNVFAAADEQGFASIG